MVRIVKTEFYKLKRYHILWAGVALMLLSVLLTLFTSMASRKRHSCNLHIGSDKWYCKSILDFGS